MLKLITDYTSPILRQKTENISLDKIKEYTEIVDEMLAIMEKNNGVGLAAPQVDLPVSLFVMDYPPYKKLSFFNPKIIYASTDFVDMVEGCLSLPGIERRIWRPSFIVWKYTTLEGTTNEGTIYGMAARIIQHEIDHLNGVLIVDHIRPEGVKKYEVPRM